MEPAAYLEMAETETRHWWFLGRRAILVSVIEQLQLPASSRILEVGCGTGGNLEMLARFGEVSALEMDPTARDLAMKSTGQRYVIKAGCCPLDIPFKDGQFDLICMFDVLEHIERDEETLKALHRLLKPNGQLFITVPAYQWLFGQHDRFLHHKRRYTSSNFLAKAAAVAFSPVKISYFNTFLFPLISLVRLKQRLTRDPYVVGTKPPQNLVNTIFRKVFGAERFFLKYFNLPFGISLLCVLRKADSGPGGVATPSGT